MKVKNILYLIKYYQRKKSNNALFWYNVIGDSMKKLFIVILVILCIVVLGLIIATLAKEKDKPSTNNSNNIKFDIVKTETDLSCMNTPGYSYVEKDDSTIIKICRGTKPTGGYELDVKKVEYKDDTLYVYVKDSNPRGTVTQALTDPTITIKVYQKAKSIVIKGNEDYKEYKKEQN